MNQRRIYRWWLWNPIGYWLVPCIAAVLCGLAVLLQDVEPAARQSLVAVGISLVFFDQRHRHEATRLLREVSERCNERYDAIWEGLQDSLGGTDPPHDNMAFTRYLNLCAEEWLYQTLGLLHPIVWTSWANGMKRLFEEHEELRVFAKRELQSASYYGFKLDCIGVT